MSAATPPWQTRLVAQGLGLYAVLLIGKALSMKALLDTSGPELLGGRLVDLSIAFICYTYQESAIFLVALAIIAGLRGLGSRAAKPCALAFMGAVPLLGFYTVLNLPYFQFFFTPMLCSDLGQVSFVSTFAKAVPWRSGVVLGYAAAALLLLCVLPLRLRMDLRPVAAIAAAWALLTCGVRAFSPRAFDVDANLGPTPVVWTAQSCAFEGWVIDESVTLDAALAEIARELPRDLVPAPLAPRPAGRRYNVVVWMLESARADALSLNNPASLVGRGLEPLRGRITSLTALYAPIAISLHGNYAFLYGQYPFFSEYLSQRRARVPATVSLAERLKDAGYDTVLLSSANQDYDHSVNLFRGKGFDVIRDANALRSQPYAQDAFGLDDVVLVDEARRYLEAHTREEPARPFYLQLITLAGHQPFLDVVPAAQRVHPSARSGREQYENELNYDYGLVAQLYLWMEERGLTRDTLFVVLGDHGVGFGEHPGRILGKFYQFDEHVRIAGLFVRPPDLDLPPSYGAVASMVDLAPTLLEILGVPALHDVAGRSLFSADRPALAFMVGDGILGSYSVRAGDWKYVYGPYHGEERLFDLGRDAAERTNRVGENPRLCRAMNQLVKAWARLHQQELDRLWR